MKQKWCVFIESRSTNTYFETRVDGCVKGQKRVWLFALLYKCAWLCECEDASLNACASARTAVGLRAWLPGNVCVCSSFFELQVLSGGRGSDYNKASKK